MRMPRLHAFALCALLALALPALGFGQVSDGDPNPTMKTATAGCVAVSSPPVLVAGKVYPCYIDTSGNQLGASGGTVTVQTIATAVTTNTTTAAVEIQSGIRTLWGEVVCSSGSCIQTQEWFGDRDNDAANGISICTLTLNDTTRAQSSCVVEGPYKYVYVKTTLTSGTGAAGAMYVLK